MRSRFRYVTVAILCLFAVTERPGQPVQPPIVNFGQYQGTELNPYFAAAQQANSQAQFESMITLGLNNIRAQWEAQADSIIQTEVGLVTNSDAFNTTADYQDYLFGVLSLQKENARGNWEIAADAQIAQERGVFTSALQAKDADLSALKAAVQNPAIQADSQAKLQAEKALWEKNYQNELEKGLNDYSAALGAIGDNYGTVLDQLAQTDAQYQQNLANLQAAEQRVRDAIALNTQNLRNYLTSSGLFYDAACVSPPNCTMNAAGTELQTLLDQMVQKLAANAPLSQIVADMTAYLETQQNLAAQTEQTWIGQTRGNVSQSGFWDRYTPNVAPGGDWNGIDQRYSTGDDTALKAYLAASTGKVIESIDSSDVCGAGAPYWPLAWDVATCASAGGLLEAITYHAPVFWGQALVLWGPNADCSPNPNLVLGFLDCRIMENVSYSYTYTWYDANADANSQQWAGYKNDLGAAAATWRNTLLPAVTNWETQMANYQAEYASFQATAAQTALDAQTAYEAAAAKIAQARGEYVSRMEDAHTDGQKKFRQIERQMSRLARQMRKANQKGDAAAAAELQQRMDKLLTSLPADIKMDSGVGQVMAEIGNAIPTVSQELLDRANQNVPDIAVMDKVEKELSKSMNGMLNLAVAKKLDADANAAKEQAINDQVSMLQSLNGSVQRQARYGEAFQQALQERGFTSTNGLGAATQKELQDRTNAILNGWGLTDSGFSVTRHPDGSVTVTRDVPTGEARLRPWTDPTKDSSYEMVTRATSTTFAPPGSMRLAKTGGLMQNWDMNAVLQDFDAASQAHGEDLKKHFSGVENTIAKQDEEIGNSLARFEGSRTAQVTNWNTIKDLAVALLTGGTVQSWVQGQVRGQIAGAIGEATGLPSGFISALMGGAKPHEAAGQWLEGLAWQNLERASGVEGISTLLQQQLKNREQSRAKHSAARIRIEDVASFGVTYMMRNAQHSNTLGSVDKFMRSIPGVATAYNVTKNSYLQGGGLDTVTSNVTSSVTGAINGAINVAKGLLTLQGKAFDAETISAMTGVERGILLDATGRRISHEHQTWEQYTGMDNLGRTVQSQVRMATSLTQGALLKIQQNTLRGAADLSGNKKLSLKMKGQADLDFAAADDFSNMMVNPLDYVVRPLYSAVGMEKTYDNFWSGYKTATKGLREGLRTTFAKNPGLMDVAAFWSGGAMGCYQCYYAYSGRKGWNYGGDKGAAAGVVDVALQGLGYFGIDAHVGYRKDTGWDMRLGAKTPGVAALTGQSASASLTYSDGAGLGASVSASTKAAGNGVNGGVNWSQKGGFGMNLGATVGGGALNLGMSYSQHGGIGFSGGVNLAAVVGAVGGAFGANTQALTDAMTLPGGQNVGKMLGLGVDIDRRGRVTGSVSVTVPTRVGDLNLGSIDSRGQVNINRSVISDATMGQRMLDERTATLSAMQKNITSGRAGANLKARIAELAAQQGVTADKLDWSKLSDEDVSALGKVNHTDIENDPSRWDASAKASVGESFGDRLVSWFSDGFDTLTQGKITGQWAYQDAEGNFRERTCFVKGTLVRTPSGFKEIQDIRPGDEVLAWNEKSGELTISRVQQTFVRTTDAIYKVTYEDGTVIETTWSHPFYVAGQGWVKGKDLRAGMRSPTAAAIAMHNERVAMSGGFRLPVQTVAFHGGARANNVSSATVSLGADLPGAVGIASVEVVPGTETVYNFAVEEEHNYFVSTGSVLVHNESTYQNQGIVMDKDGNLVNAPGNRVPLSVTGPDGKPVNKIYEKGSDGWLRCVENCVHGQERIQYLDGGVLRQELLNEAGEIVTTNFDRNGQQVAVCPKPGECFTKIVDAPLPNGTRVRTVYSSSEVMKQTYTLAQGVCHPTQGCKVRTLENFSGFYRADEISYHGGEDIAGTNVNAMLGGTILTSTRGQAANIPGFGQRGVFANDRDPDRMITYFDNKGNRVIVPSQPEKQTDRENDFTLTGNSMVVQTVIGGKSYNVQYMHLRDPVDPRRHNTPILPGAPIGTVGTTGASFGPHVHVSVFTTGKPQGVPAKYLLQVAPETYAIAPAYFFSQIAGKP